MKKYWDYFKYVMEHKKNVFIECMKEGLILHAFTHDLSKFSPLEFFAYANHDFSSDKYDEKFERAWVHHQKRNKHHWNYWVVDAYKRKAIRMPTKYVKQMVCDWRAMSRKFGGSTAEYYLQNKWKMVLHGDTVRQIDRMLGVISDLSIFIVAPDEQKVLEKYEELLEDTPTEGIVESTNRKIKLSNGTTFTFATVEELEDYNEIYADRIWVHKEIFSMEGVRIPQPANSRLPQDQWLLYYT